MSTRSSRRACIAVAVVALLVIASAVPAVAAPDVQKQRVIVTMRPGATVDSAVDRISGKGALHVKTLKAANAAVFEVTPAERKAIAGDADVLLVEADALYTAIAKPTAPRVDESLPWGIDRIDAELVWPSTVATGVCVAVVDTGIDTSHPDLAANIVGGYNAINPSSGYKDDNGHGTHVSGTIGAIDNTVGVIGAAPKVSLLGVKVLNSQGSGYVSDIIEGMDWAVSNGAKVINMSLGGSTPVSAFQDAVTRANAAGVVVVAAAGNSGGTVGYPAAYDGVIAVSATDSSNVIAYFSSRGPEVDLAAPGVSINSTYWTRRKGSTYALLSGTSMASPHVAGAAALVLSTPVGASDVNGNGIWDPAEVEAKLEATATDLGAAGADTLYGAGLVNAFAATQP